jgi:hypothetical protein
VPVGEGAISLQKRNSCGNCGFLRYIDLDRWGVARKGAESVSMASRRTALKEHKFRIGQCVFYTSRPIGHMIANSTYEVVKLLPSDGADFQYRIKNAKEAFERVVRESQLEYSS